MIVVVQYGDDKSCEIIYPECNVIFIVIRCSNTLFIVTCVLLSV